jgi:hypothetical protein
VTGAGSAGVGAVAARFGLGRDGLELDAGRVFERGRAVAARVAREGLALVARAPGSFASTFGDAMSVSDDNKTAKPARRTKAWSLTREV